MAQPLGQGIEQLRIAFLERVGEGLQDARRLLALQAVDFAQAGIEQAAHQAAQRHGTGNPARESPRDRDEGGLLGIEHHAALVSYAGA